MGVEYSPDPGAVAPVGEDPHPAEEVAILKALQECLEGASGASGSATSRTLKAYTVDILSPLCKLSNTPSTADILFPYYGDVAMMKQAVLSVVGQTNPDWRLIVVDDGYPTT